MKLQKPCCDSDIFECLCALEQELDCIKKSLGHHRIAKEKILFCILLREISKLDKKLDQILCELDCSWSSDSDSDSDSCCFRNYERD